MDHFDLPSSKLLDAVIDKLQFMKTLSDASKPWHEKYVSGITPVTLTGTKELQYKHQKHSGRDILNISEIVTPSIIDSDKINGELMHDLARYQLDNVNKDMYDMFYRGSNGQNKSDISYEFNQLFNVILPKLIIIKKMNLLSAQKDILEGYGYKHDDLKQFLANLLNETEAEIKKYLNNGHFIQPMPMNRAILRYALK